MRLIAAMMALLFSVVAHSAAQDGPPGDLLANEVEATLPPFWGLDEVTIVAATNLGDAVEPNIKQRFEASVFPRHDLFLADEGSVDAYGPFIAVLPTAAAGTPRILYGIASSTYRAGKWAVALSLENSVEGMGMPADLFPGPTVVRGSEEEGQLRERLRADVAERLKNQLAADLERMKGDHEAQLRAVREGQEKELAGIADDHARKLADLRAQLATEKGEAEAATLAHQVTSAALLETVQSKFAKELVDLKSAHDEVKTLLQAKHENELDELRQSRASAVAKAEEENELGRRLVALEREKHAVQQELLKEIQQAAEIDRRIAADRAAAEQARVDEEAAVEERKWQEQTRRSTAAQEALRQRLVALEKPMRGDDPHAAVAAFSEAVQSDEEALRTAAMHLAFASRSGAVMHMALTRLLSSIDTLGVTYSAAIARYQNETFGGSFTVHVHSDSAKDRNGNLKATIRGMAFEPRYFEGDVMELSLSGTSLSGASKNCNLSATLNPEARRFEGTMQCTNVSTPARGRQAATFAIAMPVI